MSELEELIVEDGEVNIASPSETVKEQHLKRKRVSAVKATNKDTGESKVFDTVQEASDYTGVGTTIIRQAIKDPMHHSHTKLSMENQYVYRGSVFQPRKRGCYIPWDFQPYYRFVAAVYEVEHTEEPYGFTSHQDCCDWLGLSTSTYAIRKKSVGVGVLSAPVRSSRTRGNGGGKKYYLVFFDNKGVKSLPTYSELISKYVAPETEADTEQREVMLSELPAVEMSGEAGIDSARLAALKMLPADEVSAIMEGETETAIAVDEEISSEVEDYEQEGIPDDSSVGTDDVATEGEDDIDIW